MAEQLPVWNNAGVEPPDSLKNTGWQPGVKPAAQHMNWLFNRAFKVLDELQKGTDLTTLKQQFSTHLNDAVRHITTADRTRWNNFVVGGSDTDANNTAENVILTKGIDKGAPDAGYWYIITFKYNGSIVNKGQIAISYINQNSIAVRNQYSDVWSAWNIIGSSSALDTTDKSSIVAGVNEVNTKVTQHLDDKTKHNQFIHEGKLHQIGFGYNPTLGCMTYSIREVI